MFTFISYVKKPHLHPHLPNHSFQSCFIPNRLLHLLNTFENLIVICVQVLVFTNLFLKPGFGKSVQYLYSGSVWWLPNLFKARLITALLKIYKIINMKIVIISVGDFRSGKNYYILLLFFSLCFFYIIFYKPGLWAPIYQTSL